MWQVSRSHCQLRRENRTDIEGWNGGNGRTGLRLIQPAQYQTDTGTRAGWSVSREDKYTGSKKTRLAVKQTSRKVENHKGSQNGSQAVK